MRKFLFLLLVGVILTTTLFAPRVFSQNVSDLNLDAVNRKLNELSSALEASKKATAPLESQITSLQKQLTGIENQVAAIEVDLIEKEKIIEEGYQDLSENKDIFNKTVRNYYIKSYFLSPLLVFVSSADAADITRIIIFQKRGAERDKDTITNLALKITDLEERRNKLENDKGRLAKINETLAAEKEEISKVVKGAKDYQASLTSEIAKLSARQKEILGQRLAGLNLPSSLGAGPLFCTDDRKIDPGFSPRFAFFTFGIPHRVGMNQYGALGRAQSGQSHEDILRAYFDGINFETRDNINISVQGYGSMPLETYLLGIYEMPESWPLEALKAQVIAARSYALAYTSNGASEICTTQACQVYKQPPKTGQWVQAVNETAGKVMTNGGQVITAWYASTAGGYTFPNEAVWGGSHRAWTKNLRDTTGDIGGFSDILSKSYDKESPCAYAAQGVRSEYGKSAWLKPSEIADISNVILLSRACGDCGEHLYQVDKPNPAGTDTWNQDRVKQELSNRGITPFDNVSDVSISADFGAGRTTSVTISGNKTESFSGDEFKNWFNLRAPANLQIVGPLFNIEKQ